MRPSVYSSEPLGGWSATLTLPDYGRVARDSGQFHEAPVKRLWLRHCDEYPTTPGRDAQVSRRQTDQEFTI